MPNFIEDDGILLPEFLFYFDDSKSKSDSPAAAFNPAAAIEGNGFEVTTSPSNQPTKRSIIIDESSLVSYPELGERIALIKRLKIAGFKIFLRGRPADNGNFFHEVGEDLENYRQLSTLTKFDEHADYKALAEKGVVRDKSLIFGRSDKGQAKDVMTAFTRINYCGPISGNDLSCEMRSNVAEFIFDKNNPKGDLWESEKLAQLTFYLSRVSPEAAQAKIKDIYASLSGYLTRDIARYEIEGERRALDLQGKLLQMTMSLIDALPSLKETLVKELKTCYNKNLFIFLRKNEETESESLRKHLADQVYSPHKLLTAIKILPDQEDYLLKKYSNDFLRKDYKQIYRTLEEMNNLFPRRKEEIIAKLKDLSHSHSDGGHSDENEKISCAILKNLFSNKPCEDFPEFTKFESELDRKYDKLYAFVEASQKSDARDFYDFYEKKFLENVAQDLEKYGHLHTCIFKLSPPRMAEKILGLIQNSPLADKRMQTSPFAVIYAINALPEKAQELVKKYQPFSGDHNSKVVSYLINALPYEIRNCVLDLDDQFLGKSDLKSLHYSAESGEKSKPTYLNVTNLGQIHTGHNPEVDFQALKNAVIKGDFSTIKFGNDIYAGTIPAFLDVLNKASASEYSEDQLRRLRSVRHFIFPKKYWAELSQTAVFKDFRSRDVTFEFVDYKNYLGIGDAIQRGREIDLQEAERIAKVFGGASGEPIIATPPLETVNKIRVAQGQNATKLGVENSDVTPALIMISAGEVLNDSSIATPQIRTSVIKRDILNNLNQEEYVPSDFEKVSWIRQLTEQDVEGFKTRNSASGVYYLFTQTLVANQRFRLLSADAAETFVGLKDNTEGVTIEKGDDGFFYATSTSERNLSYVIKAAHPRKHKDSYDEIPTNDGIRKIIDEYKNAKKGYLSSAPKEKENVGYSDSDHAVSMKKMFDERSGVCRHRVAAVEYAIANSNIDAKSFRSVNINNNHVVLEIKYKDKWISVDLGGGGAEIVEANADLVYTAAKVVEQEPTPKEKTLKDLLESESDSERDLELEDQSDTSSEIHSEELGQETAAKAETEQKENLALQKMIGKLLAVSELDKVENKEDLKTQTVNSDKKKILIVTEAIERHGNFLCQEAKSSERPTFYIDSPDKVDLHRTNLLVANNNSPTLREEGLLADFLKNAKDHPEKPPLLVINWQAFSSKQRLALNTILDKERKINGVIIDPSIQIIGLAAAASQDSSFLSRNDVSVKSEVALQKPEPENTTDVETIDLQGFSNWKRHLFGKVILQGAQMVWQKSEFVTALEEGKSNFEITNLSPEATAKLQYEFAQAQAVGKFTYHGYEINLPENFKIKCASNSFDFTKFEKTTILKNVTRADAPSDCHQINSQLFDYLLCDKSINDDGFYQEEKGLIDKCSEEEGDNKTLKLFISSNLSDSQWYCLFDQAQKRNVELEIHLAPKVEFPSQMKFEERPVPVKTEEELAALSAAPKKTARIFVSTDPNQTLEELKKTETDLFAVIDVEDFGYQDLVEKIKFEKDSSGFKNFEKVQSQFLTELKGGKKIVLKGEFSADLLQMLEPILTGKEPEFAEIKENLILIVENKSCEKGKVFEPLKWLPKDGYEVKNYPKSDLPLSTELSYLEGAVSTDLDNSAEDSQTFIATRKTKFSETLQGNSMLRLVGHSGVGKSRLIKEFEVEDEAITAIYRELTSFEDWAKQDEGDKVKILFIDESNIEDRHFTMFSPLKERGKKEIFYQGKFYPLGDRHKVVFACNPADYGGGRFEQKLFSDGKIPAIELRDFPASYIYEKILKDSIYEELSDEVKGKISEPKFKEICQPLITEYQRVNSKKKSDKDANEETVRELQEKVLKGILLTIEPEEFVDKKTKSFISTEAAKEVEKALDRSLSIRQKQREGKFPNKAVGLNGVLLEGDSGVGKSVLIEAVLNGRGITERKLKDAESTKQQFYKIDANLPLDKKKEIITKAFEEGNIVWIDEINSCIDDGLEKVLNAALTGDHPGGTVINPKPGFMLISSVNSIALEGRSLISPALRHRVVAPKVKSLKEYSSDDLAKIVKHWILQDDKIEEGIVDSACQRIANDFQFCLKSKGGEDLNLRMLQNNLAEILPDYCALGELFKDPEVKSGKKKKPREEESKIISGAFERRDGKTKMFHLSKKDFVASDSKVDAEMIEEILKTLAEKDNPSSLYYAEFVGLKFDFAGLGKEKTEEFFKSSFYANFRKCTFENLDLTYLEPEVKKSIDSMIFPGCIFKDASLPEDFKFKWSSNVSGESKHLEARPEGAKKGEGVDRSIERLRHLPSSTVSLTSVSKLTSTEKGRS